MAWRVKQTNTNSSQGRWRVKQSNQPIQGGWRVKQPNQQPAPQAPQQRGGVWNTLTRNLIKPLSSASNLLEDVGKIGGYGLAKLEGYKGSFANAAKKGDIAPWQHQKDVWAGRNQRTYSDIAREIANKQDNKLLRGMIKTTGYAGDFMLDPLNKLKIASLTNKGVKAAKVGKLALSAGEQARRGERAVAQIGKYSVLPKSFNRAILGSSTRLNDYLRGTKTGSKLATILSKAPGRIRPGGVSREEFKVLRDAEETAKNLIGYKKEKAINFAKGLSKELYKRKATQFDNSQLLHAIEKGDKKLAPKGLKDLFDKGLAFKKTNEEAWKSLGGSVLEGHGLSHVANKEVAEQARKNSFKGQGYKLTSTKTPQDIHRQWVSANGKITNLKKAGIKYIDNLFEKGKGGFIDKSGNVVKVSQASAQEINNAMVKAGGKAIFKEDLPIVAAKMGISTGRKQAGVEFLEATKGLKGEEAKKLANKTYEAMTNNETIRKAIQTFDKIQNLWKAQALVGASYHVRNFAGNLWNNFLADVKYPFYAKAIKIQNDIKFGKLSAKELKLVDEMEKHGVIGEGFFARDIAEHVDTKLGRASWNPLSQKFGLFKANRKVGSVIEDNARIAHYLSKRAEGYSAKEAAKSVKKYLFDYSDLKPVEQQLFKRVMPFYTWTSKNIPLQVERALKNPGKFSKIGIAKHDIESGVKRPNEKYLSDYISSNNPIRYKTENGITKYFLLGQWLPAAAALQVLSEPIDAIIGQTTPLAKLPLETTFNQGSYFKNTLGNFEKIKKYHGQKSSYLGVDLDPRTINALRSIRPLNEINKLNPGEVFGAKNKPSIFKGILKNASNQRGGKHTPESTQWDRLLEMFIGKSQNYNPNYAKTFYDRDTSSKLTDYNASIKRARKNKQYELVKEILRKRNEFRKARNKPYY